MFVVVVERNCRSLEIGVSSVKSAPWEGVVPGGQQEPSTSGRANTRALAAVVVLGGRGGVESERGWSGRRWVACRRRRCVVVVQCQCQCQSPGASCGERERQRAGQARQARPLARPDFGASRADLLGWWRRNLEANQNSQACCHAATKLNFWPCNVIKASKISS